MSTLTPNRLARAEHPPPRAQRGSTLIESLIAFLVLAAGVLSVAQLQLHLRVQADLARQRASALRIAQDDLEALRTQTHLSVGSVPESTAPYERIESDSAAVDPLNGPAEGTPFQWQRQIGEHPALRLKDATVRVSWDGRDGHLHHATLNAAIAGENLALIGALTQPSGPRGPGSSYRRSPGIPWTARDLGDGRSAQALAGVAYLFDPWTAQVTQRCDDLPAGMETAQVQASDLSHCSAQSGRWLSGTVRFSNSEPPDPVAANDLPLATALSIALSDPAGTVAPTCHTAAMKTVLYRLSDGPHRQAVPLDATPASVGALEWSELGERYLAYECMVPTTPATGHWSGRSTLTPQGWTLGMTLVDHKVCRYVTDLDHSGAIDRNDEHPSTYRDVDHALKQQNFLVIRGDQTCPDGTALRMDTLTAADTSRPVTVQHQP